MRPNSWNIYRDFPLVGESSDTDNSTLSIRHLSDLLLPAFAVIAEITDVAQIKNAQQPKHKVETLTQ